MENDRQLAGEHSRATVDARLSLVLATAWIAAVFSAESWGQLTVLAVVALFFLLRLAALPDFWQRLVWLRWFFLLVLLLHLLLSPGYTLFGLAWLSRDGLLHGLHVSAQIAIALAASLVLVRSATPEQLAGAAASLLRPLRVFGVDVKRFAEQVLLALHFVPVLREESAAVSAQLPASESQLGRFRLYVENLTVSLVARADRMVHEAVSGDHRSEIEPLPPLIPLNLEEWLFSGAAALTALVYFGLS